MNFKQYYQSLYTILALNFLGCLGTETSWEDLESNYDHVLNVFGLMNLDSGQTSFIGLYRTTDLEEISQNFEGVDTWRQLGILLNIAGARCPKSVSETPPLLGTPFYRKMWA